MSKFLTSSRHFGELRKALLTGGTKLFLLSFLLAHLTASASSNCLNVITDLDTSPAFTELAQLRILLDTHYQDPGYSFLEPLYQIKFDELRAQKSLTQDQLRDLLRSKIPEIQGRSSSPDENRRRDVKFPVKDLLFDLRELRARADRERHLHTGTPARFNVVLPNLARPEATIDSSIEVMSTLVTNELWRKLALLANEKRKTRLQIAEIKYIPKFSPEEAQHPVTFLNDDGEIINLQNALNNFWEIEGLEELLIGHQNRDVYRILTNKEWEFIARSGAQFQTKYFWGDDTSSLEEFSWLEAPEVTGASGYPVAQKLPLVLNDDLFFDMGGNVCEYTSGAPDFVNPNSGSRATQVSARGGRTIETAAIDWIYLNFLRGTKGEPCGFRLVRMRGR